MTPKVAILLLNWNGKKWLEDCLTSIFNLNYSNFDVVMVDNASSDNSVAYVRDKFPKVKLIQNSENLGYSVGFNIGLSYSMKKGYEYSLVMNNDTEIDKNALHELVKTAEKDNKIGFTTGKVYYFYQLPVLLITPDFSNLLINHQDFDTIFSSPYSIVY